MFVETGELFFKEKKALIAESGSFQKKGVVDSGDWRAVPRREKGVVDS